VLRFEHREACERLGIRVFKVGVVWPLEAATVREFAGLAATRTCALSVRFMRTWSMRT